MLKPPKINRQVGTRRYMSPEVLDNTLNIHNFVEFKKSDIYSLSLVFWEVFKRVEMPSDILRHEHANNQSTDSGMGTGGSSENCENPVGHQVVSNKENAPLIGSVNPRTSFDMAYYIDASTWKLASV